MTSVRWMRHEILALRVLVILMAVGWFVIPSPRSFPGWWIGPLVILTIQSGLLVIQIILWIGERPDDADVSPEDVSPNNKEGV